MLDVNRRRYSLDTTAVHPENSASTDGSSSQSPPGYMRRATPKPDNPVFASLRTLRMGRQAAVAPAELKPPASDLLPNARILERFTNGLATFENVCKVTTAIIGDKNLSPTAAYACLTALKDVGVAPNLFIYNALIANFGRNGQADRAFAMYEELRNSGLVPSIFTFSALIAACGKAGRADQAMAVFADMHRHGVAPNLITFSALISACGNTGRADQALAVFTDMYRHGVAPNLITFNALISACNQGNLEQIMHIPYLLRAMVEANLAHPALGYTADDDVLDFHNRCILVTPRRESHDAGVNAAVAKAIFYHHVAKGRLSENTKFIVGQHGDNTIKATISRCISDLGWIPRYDSTVDGHANLGCLKAQLPRSFSYQR